MYLKVFSGTVLSCRLFDHVDAEEVEVFGSLKMV